MRLRLSVWTGCQTGDKSGQEGTRNTMRAYLAMIPITVMLTACGDPLAGVERVSDGVQLPEEDGATAFPTQEELDRETSVLSGLFRRPQSPEDIATQGALAEADTPATVPDVADDDALIDPLLDVAQIETSEDVVSPPDGPESPVEVAAQTAEDATVTADASIIEASEQTLEPKPKGVIGWLRRAAEAEEAASATPEQVASGADANEDLDFDVATTLTEDGSREEVQLASLSPEAIQNAPEGSLAEPSDLTASSDLVEPKKRRGLFGRAAPAPTAGLALRDVAIGTRLPFGEVGRVCGVRPPALGTRIDQAARKGSDYALFDSVPNGTTPRTFYVTGFSDNCARQFTASLALFGSPEFHEQLRYGLPAKEYPYSTTDTAYEKVKQSVCKVGRDTACGPRIDRLNNTTVFVSIYEKFEDNARWADMLLHDGALLATAVKTP